MPRLFLAALGLMLLAGCADRTAASLGLTGAPTAAPPVQPSDADIGMPGVGQGSDPYTPSLAPETGANGHYFGYN